jgi:hypothetical protein
MLIVLMHLFLETVFGMFDLPPQGRVNQPGNREYSGESNG